MSNGLSRPSLFSVSAFDRLLWMSSHPLPALGNACESNQMFAGSTVVVPWSCFWGVGSWYVKVDTDRVLSSTKPVMITLGEGWICNWRVANRCLTFCRGYGLLLEDCQTGLLASHLF
jgi:hypothetical protein